jgi:hypothetical protein
VGIQLADEERPSAVKVDRPGVTLVIDARPVDTAQRFPGPRVEDGERLSRGARVDVAVRSSPERQVELAPLVHRQPPLAGQTVGQLQSTGKLRPQLVDRQRFLRRRADEMAPGDQRVRRIEHGLLERLTEEKLRMADDVLVQRVRHGDQHDGPRATVAADAADPLPRRDQRAGIADQHADVESPDVDSQLQRARAEHRRQLAAEEPRLESPSLFGQVPGAVGRDAVGELGLLPHEPRVQQLGHAARLGEGDRAPVGANRLGDHVYRRRVR